jgi:hypothetical protein
MRKAGDFEKQLAVYKLQQRLYRKLTRELCWRETVGY